jgi:hypothetical protein
MNRKPPWRWVIPLLLVLASHRSVGQVGRLMYGPIPPYSPDTLLVFHDYNAHLFLGYDDCTKYTAANYGFQFEYHGRLRPIGYRIMRADWLNRRWRQQMRRRNGPNWQDAYERDVRNCHEEAVFQEYAGVLADTTVARLKNITSKAQLLGVPPLQFLGYLATTTLHYGLDPTGKDVALEMRRDVKFLVRPQDKWVQKADVAGLIKFIYADRAARRACLCPDTVLLGQPTTLALEAYKLIALYRGYDYPTSFPSVSRAQVEALFSWWLEERKKP